MAKKKEPTKAISVRMDSELLHAINVVARAEGVTVSEAIREIVAENIAARGSDPEFQKRIKKQLEEDLAFVRRLAEGKTGLEDAAR